jgi:formylglycine-generating enzyme required for sulfatase activity/UDP-3-O-[3-hydroxymyristoyl] glucosamine N-acyltransferase
MREMVVGFGISLTAVAQAADADRDGCEDSITSYCQHPTASVHASVAVGGGSTIGAGASLGPDLSLGAGVIVHPRAALAGRSTGPAPQAVGAGSTVGRRANIGADATIATTVVIAPDTSIGARFTAGAGASVGYGAVLEDDVTIEAGAVVGNLAHLFDGATLGPLAALGRASTVGARSTVNGDVGADVQIGEDATVHASAQVRSGATLADDVVVLGNARVGRDAQIGAGAEIGVNAVVRAGGVVPACRRLPAGAVVPRGATWAGTDTVPGCGGLPSPVVDLPGPDDLVFVEIPAGTFTMGCVAGRDDPPTTDCGAWSAGAGPHSVTLTRDFWLGKYEITQAQWLAILGDHGINNPFYFDGGAAPACGSNCPAAIVKWHQAAFLANALSTQQGLPSCYTCTGSFPSGTCTSPTDPYACTGYRLPTEAEWEYAARAGGSFTFSGSNTVGDVAWYEVNSPTTVQPIGTRAPNAWGLYDLTGNVSEWTNDWTNAQPFETSPVTDPVGVPYSTGGFFPAVHKVIRGGSYLDTLTYQRNSFRVGRLPTNNNFDGVRLARTAP